MGVIFPWEGRICFERTKIIQKETALLSEILLAMVTCSHSQERIGARSPNPKVGISDAQQLHTFTLHFIHSFLHFLHSFLHFHVHTYTTCHGISFIQLPLLTFSPVILYVDVGFTDDFGLCTQRRSLTSPIPFIIYLSCFIFHTIDFLFSFRPFRLYTT
jgi:hypothetical protein